MSKGAGGGGRPGRSGGGGSTNGDAGQPGEVVREANKANAEFNAIDKRVKSLEPGSPEHQAAMKEWWPAFHAKNEANAAADKAKGIVAPKKSATDFRYEMDQMESGTRYANRNLPGSTMLSEREVRRMENMGTRSIKQATKAEQSKVMDKATWKFPSNPKKGETVVNGYGAKRVWTGSYWQ
jgi:hypothetical protein